MTSTTQKPKSQRSRNLGGKKNTRGKSYGIKKNDGCFVHKGEIIVNQCGLRFYPGENVRLFLYVYHNYMLFLPPLELYTSTLYFIFQLIDRNVTEDFLYQGL